MHFFDFSNRNIWSNKKNVVPLHAFSSKKHVIIINQGSEFA